MSKKRTTSAHYSNPSDYVRSLIREDQRRVAATQLLDTIMTEYVSAHPHASTVYIEKLRTKFWTRWTALKADIDAGVTSLDTHGGKILNDTLLTGVKYRGRAKLQKDIHI